MFSIASSITVNVRRLIRTNDLATTACNLCQENHRTGLVVGNVFHCCKNNYKKIAVSLKDFAVKEVR